jgi:hypothetical protein
LTSHFDLAFLRERRRPRHEEANERRDIGRERQEEALVQRLFEISVAVGPFRSASTYAARLELMKPDAP